MLNLEHRIILRMSPQYDHLPLAQKVEVFEHCIGMGSSHDLANLLWLKSPTSEEWFERRTNYTRSLAVMSMVGYILGEFDPRIPRGLRDCTQVFSIIGGVANSRLNASIPRSRRSPSVQLDVAHLGKDPPHRLWRLFRGGHDEREVPGENSFPTHQDAYPCHGGDWYRGNVSNNLRKSTQSAQKSQGLSHGRSGSIRLRSFVELAIGGSKSADCEVEARDAKADGYYCRQGYLRSRTARPANCGTQSGAR